ncbi:MAG: DUF1905 domain-containing protein [Flavobacteriaceae bacterium]
MKGIKYEFTGISWQYNPPKGWYFVNLPQDFSEEIRKNFKKEEEGWGRLKAIAKVGKTEWKTAIWYDTKWRTYLLPLKAEIRKKESISVKNEIVVEIWI